jgi:flagellar export protein FliJ
MPKFTFSLTSLLTYRRHRRELCRQLLAEVLADDLRLRAEQEELRHEHGELLDELRDLGRGGGFDVDRAAARRYYAALVSRRIDASMERRQLVANQLHLCRQALVKADGEVRTLERLEETRRSEFRAEHERRAALELEDIWNARRRVQTRQERS